MTQVSSSGELERCQQLLKGVASATNRLLTTPDYKQAVDEALAILGKATQVDRVYIFETHPHPENAEPAMSQRWEWTALGVVPELDNPELQNLLYKELLPRWYEELSNLRPIVGLTETFPLPEREILEPQGVLSILVVPIVIREHCWGFIGFDQCRTAYQWSELEVETLRAIAGSLGGAIAQNQAEEKLQALNHQLETAVEDRTCALRQANAELADTLDSLKIAQTQLIHAEKMTGLGQIVAGIAHEINNPATFIYSNLRHVKAYFTDLIDLVELYQSEYSESTPLIEAELEEKDVDFVKEDFGKAIDSMAQGIRRINKIIQSLYSFSRHNEAEYKSVDIHQGLESALDLLQYRLSPADLNTTELNSTELNSTELNIIDRQQIISVEKQYDTALPSVMCCGGSLNQVFLSIFNNAIDALEEKTLQEQQQRPNKLAIATQKLDSDRVRICITDNANGIAPEIQPKIFDPFFTAKPIGQGTGLGLSIAYQIVVQQHKGQLICQSEVNSGTRFIIELPCSTSPASNSISDSIGHSTDNPPEDSPPEDSSPEDSPPDNLLSGITQPSI